MLIKKKDAFHFLMHHQQKLDAINARFRKSKNIRDNELHSFSIVGHGFVNSQFYIIEKHYIGLTNCKFRIMLTSNAEWISTTLLKQNNKLIIDRIDTNGQNLNNPTHFSLLINHILLEATSARSDKIKGTIKLTNVDLDISIATAFKDNGFELASSQSNLTVSLSITRHG